MLVVVGFALLLGGCASHRPVECRNPARIVGTDAGGDQEGWILVRADLDARDTAARIAAAYHVRTQALAYVHGFSTYPVPQSAKLLCDKAVIEVHYAPTHAVAAR
jgi:hypothetical protein